MRTITMRTMTMGQKVISLYLFSIPEATKLLSMAIFGSFHWIKKKSFLCIWLVYLSPSKSWRERGTERIKIPVQLLPETGFSCFRKLKRFLKTENWKCFTGYPVNLLQCTYQLQHVPMGVSIEICLNTFLNIEKDHFQMFQKNAGRKNFRKQLNPRT